MLRQGVRGGLARLRDFIVVEARQVPSARGVAGKADSSILAYGRG